MRLSRARRARGHDGHQSEDEDTSDQAEPPPDPITDHPAGRRADGDADETGAGDGGECGTGDVPLGYERGDCKPQGLIGEAVDGEGARDQASESFW